MRDLPPPVLTASHLSVRFGAGCPECEELPRGVNQCPTCGTVHAVQDVSLELAPGETLGIVGESGSGKTTLLRVLNLTQEPSEGNLVLDGTDIAHASARERRELARRGVVMVHQNFLAAGLHGNLSAEANVAERLLRTGERDFSTIRERSGALLDDLAVARGRHRDALDTYSGGMRQRVQLARALVDPPQILLLDEPTTGLDASVQAELLAVIPEVLARLGSAMVIVSHDLDVVRLLASRVLVMHRGRVVEEGIPDQLLDDPADDYTRLLVSSRLT